MLPKLISEHGLWLSGFLRGLTRSEADAEDAYQEVWLRLLKRGGLPQGANERAYLAKTARAVVIDAFRRFSQKTEPLTEDLVDTAPEPSRRFETSATHEEIIAAVRALPEPMRSVVLMRVEGELTFEEIAAELKLPLGTALSHMSRATARLKKELGGGK